MGGKVYDLRVSARHFGVGQPVSSARDIQPGWNHDARYEMRLRIGREPFNRGPLYYWNYNGKLSERAYATRTWTRSWGYDSLGDLVQFVEYSEGIPGKSISMYYGVEGELIGLLVDHKAYWMGRETEVHEMIRQFRTIYRDRH